MPKLDRVSHIALYEIDSVGMVPLTSYLLVDSLPEACFLIKILNESDKTVWVSWDNHYMHDVVLSGDKLLVQAQTNAMPNNEKAKFKRGQKFYVVITGASKSGMITFSAYY